MDLGEVFRNAAALSEQDLAVLNQAEEGDQVIAGTATGTPTSRPTVAEYLQQGHALREQGNLGDAIAQYRQAIALSPDSEAYQCLAAALTQQGDLESAASYYRLAIALTEQVAQRHQLPQPPSPPPLPPPSPRKLKAVKAKPRSIPWFEQASFHLQQGAVSCKAGDWAEAVTACQAALRQLEPEAATACLILGRSLQNQQQFAAAEQAYRKGLLLQPSAELYARLGSLYAEQQQFEQAVQPYQMAIQLNPEFAGAYWKLAEVWQQLGREAAALTCLDHAYRLQPNWGSAAAYEQLAHRFLADEQPALAQDYFTQATALQPDLLSAHLGIAVALSQQGNREAALSAYLDLLARQPPDQPRDPQLCLQLGDALLDLEQWQAALDAYESCEPQAVTAGRLKCQVELEQWPEALVSSQQQVGQAPSIGQHWHQLADILSRLNRWTEAIAAYRQAIDLDAEFSWSHHNLGAAWLQLQNWPEAVTAFRAAIALNPDFAWSHYNLAEALSQLGNWNETIAAYQAALHCQPDLPHAAVKLAEALQQRVAADRMNSFTLYRQAIEQAPDNPEHYHKALELNPDAVELYPGLVNALLLHQKFDEALVCGQIAQHLRPDCPETAAQLQQVLRQREQFRRPRDLDADYKRWMQQYTPTEADLHQMQSTAKTLTYQPLISILMPVYNAPEAFLRAAIESVLAQVYPHWELCIADDASTDKQLQAVLSEYVMQDLRIKVLYRSENGHISAASNSALAQATGEYVALLDHDDLLAPEALYEIVTLLNQHPEADMIYSDEDKLNAQGERVMPFFKPDWCPDSFLSRMYTCHLGVYRRSLVEEIGGFRGGYEGSQDYDLVLRLTEQTQQIFHLPKVLYHWRNHGNSASANSDAKPYARNAAIQAITEAHQRRGEPIRAVVTNPKNPGVYITRYELSEYKRVSILIPTRNLGEVLNQCLGSIFTKTTYPNYEVILIDNGSDDPYTLDSIQRWQQQQPDRFRCCSLDIPFNYSTLNNFAVMQASGDYLLFLNNDIEIITADWIEALVEQAQRPATGAVGGLLLYPDDTVQHAGVVLGVGGVASHGHKHFAADAQGYFSQIVSINNYSALTAACLICRRELFEQVGGFDESLAVAYNDVDLCLKIQQLGYRNLYLPHVQLYHHESKSRGAEDTVEKQQRFKLEQDLIQKRWRKELQRDPCYSPHLTLEREDYSLNVY
jgi:tetratricopeptide (TPR) repeat protein